MKFRVHGLLEETLTCETREKLGETHQRNPFKTVLNFVLELIYEN